jgi:hypothetical protein
MEEKMIKPAHTCENTLLIGSAFRYNNFVYPISYDPNYKEKAGRWIRLNVEIRCETIFHEALPNECSCSPENPEPKSDAIYVFGPNEAVSQDAVELKKIKEIGEKRFEKVSNTEGDVITIDHDTHCILQNLFRS